MPAWIISLVVPYLLIGLVLQRNAFQKPVGEHRGDLGGHRRRIPNPDVPAWLRAAFLLLWPLVFLAVSVVSLGRISVIRGFVEELKNLYRYVVLGDTCPEEQLDEARSRKIAKEKPDPGSKIHANECTPVGKVHE
ncbi:MAG: hypothetical protein HYS60_03135 [Candidatus Wildermuthbacteria bacterium]|nr:hypothetical protein [Candidatus Wildermuthbacteria bacterium]